MAVIESLKNMTFPLWNPFSFGGMPLLANFQSATFLWSNIFFFFLPFTKAWGWGVVIQPFLTILFTFIFLRHLKLNKISSLLGGVIFAFCAFSLVWLEYNVHGHAAMWLPLLLLTADRIIESKRFKWVLAGGLFLALSIFAGYPQIVFYSMTAVGFYALFRLWESWLKEKNLKKIIVSFILLISFVILGVLLSAIQWLPGYEALKLSVREIDPIASFSAGGFLPYQNLVTFI
ncbi:MAG: YfhO family protein, partial [Candidatus Shapirobacteria bacterium]|nr:YfhO family protein [Candidatus Shapirobacteria bacterium]